MEPPDRASAAPEFDQTSGHVPIMVPEILDLLSPNEGETAVDLTIGRGGHALALASRLGERGTFVGFDLDRDNLEFARRRIESDVPASRRPACSMHHANFARAPEILTETKQSADVVFADLGFASNQMDDPTRGFSFKDQGALDMRLDPDAYVTAAEIVNRSSERELANLIDRYGEEPLSRKIARTIVAERRVHPIETTLQLAEAVRQAYGKRAAYSRMHPATRTFMALRIAVNNELGNLEELCDAIARAANGDGWIHAGARIGFLTFHSLEDRIVKRMIQSLSTDGLIEKLTRKLRTAGEIERQANPRSRSAKLRVFRVVDSP